MRKLPPPAACLCNFIAAKNVKNGLETAEISLFLCMKKDDDRSPRTVREMSDHGLPSPV